jgi:hypothetical protein
MERAAASACIIDRSRQKQLRIAHISSSTQREVVVSKSTGRGIDSDRTHPNTSVTLWLLVRMRPCMQISVWTYGGRNGIWVIRTGMCDGSTHFFPKAACICVCGTLLSFIGEIETPVSQRRKSAHNKILPGSTGWTKARDGSTSATPGKHRYQVAYLPERD